MNCLPPSLFVKEKYLDSLLCEIGFGVFRDPVGLPCQHVFCRRCIDAVSQSKGLGTCPVCYEAWSKEQLAAKVEINEIINQSVVRLSLIHISEPTRQAEISYAVFCLKKKKKKKKQT
eukprot:TRINITY_DN837_c0_g1_i11.p3 TRINITY_DN837_c0_g1~~TRINITY_DN837_c0_g1_i11.p3  ORF type:complete len:117 (-),score=38.73 TRINITY_DN837_c0_g1_i11:3-353(-)